MSAVYSGSYVSKMKWLAFLV